MSALIERLYSHHAREILDWDLYLDAAIALEAANARIAELVETNNTLADALGDAEEKAATIEAQLVKANDAWLSLSQTSSPECQGCGDGITAHDPGVCGNCFAMKYRDSAVAKDAERYRHIRQGTSLTVRVPVKDKEVIYYLGHKPEAALPESLDAAIDAAIAKEKK